MPMPFIRAKSAVQAALFVRGSVKATDPEAFAGFDWYAIPLT